MNKNSLQKLRFLAVGVVNTSLDIGLLFLLTHIGLELFVANFISTSAAFAFSFYANSKFTFHASREHHKRQVLLFLAVTLFGLWVLQPLVILFVRPLLDSIGFSADFALLGAKICATLVTLVWNYVLYSRVVFKT